MGFNAPLKVFIDGAPTDKLHSQVADADYELDYVPVHDDEGAVVRVEIHAFSNRADRIAWGKKGNFPIEATYEFVDAVHAYVDQHSLPEDPDALTQAEIDALEAFESELHARLFPKPPLRSRGTGLLREGCNPNGGGVLQLLTSKPFITQKRWRNAISAYEGIIQVGVVRVGLGVWNKAWYSDSRGTYWEDLGTQLCLEGTRGDNVANSVVSY